MIIIDCPLSWPNFPYLILEHKTNKRQAVILATNLIEGWEELHPFHIYEIFEREQTLREVFENNPRFEYNSAQEIIQAGWFPAYKEWKRDQTLVAQW